MPPPTLVLLMGDVEGDISDEIKRLLNPGPVHYVLCTGNIGSKSNLEFFRSAASIEYIQTKGNKDITGIHNEYIEVESVMFNGNNIPFIKNYFNENDSKSSNMILENKKIVNIGNYRIGLLHGHGHNEDELLQLQK
eukprot:207764_1